MQRKSPTVLGQDAARAVWIFRWCCAGHRRCRRCGSVATSAGRVCEGDLRRVGLLGGGELVQPLERLECLQTALEIEQLHHLTDRRLNLPPV